MRAADIVGNQHIQVLHNHVESANGCRYDGNGEIAARMDPAEFIIVEREFANQIGTATKYHLGRAIGEDLDVTGHIGLTKAPDRTDVHVGADRPDGAAQNLRLNVDQTTRGDLQIICRAHQAVDQYIIDGADGDIAASGNSVLRAVETNGSREAYIECLVDCRRTAGSDNDIPGRLRTLDIQIGCR